MIGLDCQFYNLPIILLRHFTSDLLKTVMYRPCQHLFPPLRTENDVVENVLYRMLFMYIFLIHVTYYSRNNADYQHMHPTQAPNKERPFIPRLTDRGFLGGLL